MGRRTGKIEADCPFRILALLPDAPPGIRWKEIKAHVLQQKICAAPTLSVQLKKLAAGQYVLHEGPYYRKNPTHQLIIRTNEFAGDLVSERLRWFKEDYYKDRLRAISLWEDAPGGGFLKLEDENVLHERLELIFHVIYVQYLRMLSHIVGMRSKLEARELTELFVSIDAYSQLSLFAQVVWKNRAKIPLKTLDRSAIRIEQTNEKWPEYTPRNHPLNY
jgi:hypothetical protein